MIKRFGDVDLKFYKDYWLDDLIEHIEKIHIETKNSQRRREAKVQYFNFIKDKYPGMYNALKIMTDPVKLDCDIGDDLYDNANSTHGSRKALNLHWKELKENPKKGCKFVYIFMNGLTKIEFEFVKRYYTGKKLAIPHVTALILQDVGILPKKEGN